MSSGGDPAGGGAPRPARRQAEYFLTSAGTPDSHFPTSAGNTGLPARTTDRLIGGDQQKQSP